MASSSPAHKKQKKQKALPCLLFNEEERLLVDKIDSVLETIENRPFTLVPGKPMPDEFCTEYMEPYTGNMQEIGACIAKGSSARVVEYAISKMLTLTGNYESDNETLLDKFFFARLTITRHALKDILGALKRIEDAQEDAVLMTTVVRLVSNLDVWDDENTQDELLDILLSEKQVWECLKEAHEKLCREDKSLTGMSGMCHLAAREDYRDFRNSPYYTLYQQSQE